jgi:hypothetical protein
MYDVCLEILGIPRTKMNIKELHLHKINSSITMPKNNSLIKAIQKLIEAILSALGHTTTKTRTWHQHVVPCEDGWAVRREGNKRITSKHRKQSTAIRKAKTLAKRKKADVVIHRESGGIRDRISYKD